jgi:peptidyl-prolyl cis-trans isomerase SurA
MSRTPDASIPRRTTRARVRRLLRALGPAPLAAQALAAALAALGAASTPAPAHAQGARMLVDRIVALVNDDVITLAELESQARAFIDQDASDDKRRAVLRTALDQLIADKLVQQQIKESHLEVSDDEVERAIDDIARQNKLSRDELKDAVESRGMTYAQYRADFEKQLLRWKLIDQKVRSRVVIPESDVRAEWERIVSLEKRERMVKLWHLFFRWGEDATAKEKARVLERAREARARVLGKDTETFAAVAREVSEGPTATGGGDLGWLAGSNLLPELTRAVATMQIKDLSEPIDTPNGVHVILLEDAKLKDPTPFADMRPQLHQRLYQEEIERQMKGWVDELRRDAAITIKL